MAGKNTGAYDNQDDPLTGFEWNDRTAKAYAEGRAGSAANGHVAASDAYRAWVSGDAEKAEADQQFETAVT